MAIDYQALLSVVAEVCEQRGVTVTVKESLKGGAIVGMASVVGSLLMGPIGLAVGGILGGTFAAAQAQNRFRPIAQVITEDMTPAQRQELGARIVSAFEGFDVTDLALFSTLMLQNQNLQATAITTVISFIEKELRCQVNNRLQ